MIRKGGVAYIISLPAMPPDIGKDERKRGKNHGS